MAGEIPPLNITVNLETSGVQAGVNQATTSIKNITAAADTASTKFAGLKTVMLGTFASSALQKGITDFEGFLKDSVKAAEAAQTSVAALGTAMNNAKVNTDANREAIMKSTESMGALGFKANDTRDAFTKMITATGSVTESTRLMSVAADYARLKHEDLATAASTLTRGTTGAARAFREFGIVLDTHLPKNEAISKAFDQLNAKIGGQAAAYAQTYAGKMQIIGVQTEDLKEKIGNLLLPILTKLESWFIGSLKWLGDHKGAMEAIALVVGTVLLAVIVNVTAALYAQAAAWVAANLPLIAIIATIGLVVAAFVKLWNGSETFRKVTVDALKIVIDAFGYLVGAIGKVVEGATHLPFIGSHFKGIADAVNGAAKDIGGFSSKLDGLANKKIDIKFPNIKDQLAKAGGTSSGEPLDITGLVPGGNVDKGAAKAAAAAKKQADALAKAQTEMTKLQTDYETALKDRQDKMDAAQQDLNTKRLDAQDKYNQTYADIQQAYQDKMDSAQTTYNQAVETIEQNHQDAIAAIQQKAADNAVKIEQNADDKRQAIIQKSIDAMTGAWQSATKIDLATLFTSGGATAGGLVGAMQDQLNKILNLQKDAGNLAAQGYSQSFIDQVIAKGPDVGDQMAQAVLNATPETAEQIKSLYSKIDSVSQDGLTQLATTMNNGTTFATQAMAQEYAQVGIDMQKQLADNQANLTADLATEQSKYTDALAKAQAALNKAQTDAANARDLALAKAQDTLTNSLNAAQDAYDKSIKAISDSTDKQLTDLMTKLDAAAAKIRSLGGSVSGIGSTYVAPPGVPTVPQSYTPSATPQTDTAGTTFTGGTKLSSGAIQGATDSSGNKVFIPAAGAPQINISAPITVDGSTAPADIQNKLLSMAKFGLVSM